MHRAAQRAFRERKQSQLAELQARIQVYEHGEMERTVALQGIARRYKEENERLREENAALQQKVAQFEVEKLVAAAALYQPRKRAVDVDDDAVHSSKKVKTATGPLPLSFPIPSPYPSSPSSTSSTESYSSPAFEARSVPYRTAPLETPPFPNYPDETNNVMRTSAADDMDSPFEKFDCGFCDDNTPCVCREIFQQHIADRFGRPDHPTIKIDHVEAPGIASQAQPSIFDNLPPYQPAVPLRRKALNKQVTGGNSIFPVVQPTCSGDPRNCRACESDDFGKAFCEAVNDSIAVSEAADTMDTSEDPTPKSPVRVEPGAQAMVPCDDAWRQLKSHPNVEFSDLKLLADVVARRSKCTGPRVVISPALGSVTPERVATPIVASRPSTFPREILDNQDGTVVAGHQRIGIRAVPMEAVQAALDLLDARNNMSLS